MTYKETETTAKLVFSVAEHPDRNTTIWHTVFAYNDQAWELKETLHKGERVKITGTPFAWQAKTANGEQVQKQGINLANLTRLPSRSKN